MEAVLLLANFILGALPFGYWVGKRVKKIDIRNFGSGNIGATNVFRVIGKKWGILVFILDFFKGFSLLFLTHALVISSQKPGFYILLAFSAIAGHTWTPFLKFRGGKGVATSLGALTALIFPFQPLRPVLLSAIFIWLVVFYFSKIVSLASILAGLTFFILALILVEVIELRILAAVLFVLILFRHKKNIARMIKKQENKVG